MMHLSTKMFFLHLLETDHHDQDWKRELHFIKATKRSFLFPEEASSKTVQNNLCKELFVARLIDHEQDIFFLVREVCSSVLKNRRPYFLQPIASFEKNYKKWIDPKLWFSYWRDYQILIDQALEQGVISSVPTCLEEIIQTPMLRDFIAKKVFHVSETRI